MRRTGFRRRRIGDLVAAQGRAMIDTFAKNGRPVRHIHIDKLDKESLGELLMQSMIETISTGYAMGIDPFSISRPSKRRRSSPRSIWRRTEASARASYGASAPTFAPAPSVRLATCALPPRRAPSFDGERQTQCARHKARRRSHAQNNREAISRYCGHRRNRRQPTPAPPWTTASPDQCRSSA